MSVLSITLLELTEILDQAKANQDHLTVFFSHVLLKIPNLFWILFCQILIDLFKIYLVKH